jgi:hypothetical protein
VLSEFEPVADEDPDKKIAGFGFKTDQYGKDFICLSDAGVETCYRREKE